MVTTWVAWHPDPCRVRGPAHALSPNGWLPEGESRPLVKGDGRRWPRGAV